MSFRLAAMHPCDFFRKLYQFPRCCEQCRQPRRPCTDIPVLTGDLLACPTWSLPTEAPFRRPMLLFRRRWSNKVVTVASPEVPNFGDASVAFSFYGCGTKLVWTITGPRQFLDELAVAGTVRPNSKRTSWCRFFYEGGTSSSHCNSVVMKS